MPKLTDEMLKAIMPLSTSANRSKALPNLNQTAVHYSITTPQRLRMWLSAIAQESGQLRYQEEIASGSAYEGRVDLGNIHPGDGKKFKGHGRIQITGRANTQAYTDYLRKSGHLPFVDFIINPEKLAQEPYATDSAGWFVAEYKKINYLADAGNLLAYHVRINGKNKKTGLPNGWEERQDFYNRAKRVISDSFILTSDPVAPPVVSAPNAEPNDQTKNVDVNLTANSTSVSVSQPSNTQDVNQPTVVEGPKLYQGVGLFPALKKDFAAIGGGNLSFQSLSEYAQQASGWPPWVVALVGKVAIAVVVASVAWLLFRLVHYLAFKISDYLRMKHESEINSNPEKRNVIYVDNGSSTGGTE